MAFRAGDKVESSLDLAAPLGVGHVVQDRGVIDGVHMYVVAWSPPESMPQTRLTPEDELRPLPDDDLAA
jgi:hypothetical protein